MCSQGSSSKALGASVYSAEVQASSPKDWILTAHPLSIHFKNKNNDNNNGHFYSALFHQQGWAHKTLQELHKTSE